MLHLERFRKTFTYQLLIMFYYREEKSFSDVLFFFDDETNPSWTTYSAHSHATPLLADEILLSCCIGKVQRAKLILSCNVVGLLRSSYIIIIRLRWSLSSSSYPFLQIFRQIYLHQTPTRLFVQKLDSPSLRLFTNCIETHFEENKVLSFLLLCVWVV